MVTPSIGTELKDIFLFSTQKWIDADLPLFYQFEYVSFIKSIIVLQSRSVLSYGYSQLPAGLESMNNAVEIFAQVIDNLNANTTISNSVVVLKGQTFTLTAMTEFVSFTKNQSNYNIDELKQHNALSLYLINTVNCTFAPNCSALNRKDCFKTTVLANRVDLLETALIATRHAIYLIPLLWL